MTHYKAASTVQLIAAERAAPEYSELPLTPGFSLYRALRLFETFISGLEVCSDQHMNVFEEG